MLHTASRYSSGNWQEKYIKGNMVTHVLNHCQKVASIVRPVMAIFFAFILVASISMCKSQTPECPEETSVGTYPDCTCTEENYDYNANLNKCFRVCPENSHGYWPKCICDDDGYTFDKIKFDCIACPPKSSGIYPDCICEDDDNAYEKEKNICSYQCPLDSHGNFPDCFCENGGTYDDSLNRCNNECPSNSEGAYPECICNDDNGTYEISENECKVCPTGSIGKYPKCNCTNGDFYISFTNNCANITCQESSGIYPKCKCDKDGEIYTAYLNQCYVPCSENMFFADFPHCACKRGYYYDDTERLCKSNIGRECPQNSIGVGPDCLCLIEGEYFLGYSSDKWKCFGRRKLPGQRKPFPAVCPNGDDYPQCGGSISPAVLRSLVG